MGTFLATLLLLSRAACAAGAGPTAPPPADETTVHLAEYFLKTPTADVNPKLVTPFLEVNVETLPKKLRGPVAAKQVELSGLLRLHATKKAGLVISPLEGCSEKDYVKPLNTAGFYFGYEEVNEDELKYVMDKTKCTEIDLGCRFTLLIFYQKKKDRVLKFMGMDPIMALVAESRRKNSGGNTNFFGSSFSCMH